MSNELTNYFQEMLPALEAEMRTVLRADGPPPAPFYGMLQYHMGWLDADLQPANVNSGKRIRPIMCLLTCQAAGGNWRQALPAAAAIEILHNFSLIHDDVEDNSPTRRGRETVWKIWGVEQAINSGDAMFALAHLSLNRLIERGIASPVVVQALRRFDETCLALTQGQHDDMDFETRDQVSVDEYLAMITGKTAVLIAYSTEIGALVAGADPATVEHYAQFGRSLGLAFQVIDDILGIWGDEVLTGKSTATDITTKKKTLPVLYGLAQNAALRELYGREVDEGFVETAVTLLNQSGAREYARDKATAYSQSALSHLEATQAQGPAAAALQQLANMLLQRDY
ncbi:MAG: polyprenyl synthetase family protein [Ardenticatenaceae bacterium]|nr:polyprenyl synthetase family protein [Ardenticatenaceae bacterium]